jgi:hypothetical protein
MLARSAGSQVGSLLFGPRGGARTLRLARDHGHAGLVVVALCAVAVVVFRALLVSRSTNVRIPLVLGGAFVLSEVLVNLGANGQLAVRRYAVVPDAILTLALVYGAAVADWNWRGFVATALCGLVMIAGLANFWRDDPPGRYLRCVACPEWDDEVRAWESGETDELEIWPYPGRSMTLRNPNRVEQTRRPFATGEKGQIERPLDDVTFPAGASPPRPAPRPTASSGGHSRV